MQIRDAWVSDHQPSAYQHKLPVESKLHETGRLVVSCHVFGVAKLQRVNNGRGVDARQGEGDN